jgi:hypothetical protein
MSHILIISLVAHKEDRFAYPILSLIFLLIGYTLKDNIKTSPRLVKYFFWLYIFIEVFIQT